MTQSTVAGGRLRDQIVERIRARWWLITTLLVLGVLMVLVLDPAEPRVRPESTAPTTSPPAAPAASAPVTTPPPSPSAVATTTTAAPPPSPAGLALPSGWRLYRDRTGFAVAAPTAWRVSREGTMVYFREQSGQRRVLGIDQTRDPKPDPVADWEQQEAVRVAAGDWRDYRRVRIEAVDYFLEAADWEFTYAGTSGRVHVLNRGFVTAPDQAYGMYWSTPDSTWIANLDEFALIAQSFQPR